jgi:DEAD/DEAH box helicase
MLQDQLRYASALTASVTVAPDATWNEITQTAHLNEINVPRHKLQDMLHALVEKAYGMMEHDILLDRREDVFIGRKDGVATFDRPNSLQDLPNATNEGYSYLRANSCFTKERDGLANLFKRDATLHDRFTLPYLVDNKPVWNLPEIGRYINIVDEFKSILACLVYWLSGMPPRGTEFTGTLICNTSQRRRNILCAQGDLVMEHTYTKSESSTGFGRPVMRLPAHRLQRLLEEYIVVVKPVYDAFILLLKGDTADTTTEYHCLLWTLDGHEMTPAELSKSLRRLSLEYLGYPIGLRPWRQLMIQFSTYILPLEIRNLPLTTYVVTAQASHGQAAEDKNYNRQAGLTFEQVCSSQFGEYRRASLAWVEAFGFPHPTLKSCVAIHGAQPSFDPHHMITEISARVIAGAKVMREEEKKEQLARQISSQIRSTPSPCRFEPLDVPVTRRALTLLQTLYPSVKSFRSPEQGMCIEYAMLQRATPLFAIHPMGHGKSSIYLAPMVAEKGLKTTVLVVPLLSLAQSAAANAEALGFSAKFFNPTTSNPQAVEQFLSIDLIVMTYDLISANSQIWVWLFQMAQGKRLTRIVIDEAHTIITESHYRPRFTTLYGKAILLKVPIVFLSGTMPETICHQLLDTFQDHRMVYLSRLPGDRPQLSYSVDSQILASQESIPSFCSRVRAEFLPQMAKDTQARLIIFSRKVDWANAIAVNLGTRLYTGPRALQDKQQDLEEWLSDEEQTVGQVRTVSHSASSTITHTLNILANSIFDFSHGTRSRQGQCQLCAPVRGSLRRHHHGTDGCSCREKWPARTSPSLSSVEIGNQSRRNHRGI